MYLYADAMSQSSGSSSRVCQYIVEQRNGMCIGYCTKQTTLGNTANMSMVAQSSATNKGYPFQLGNLTFDSIILKSVLGTGNYRVYGKRKW